VTIESDSSVVAEHTFSRPFRIGRSEGCELRIEGTLVSRTHLEVAYRDGSWRARDPGSRNGTYLDGQRIDEIALGGEVALRIAKDGPIVRFRTGPSVGAPLRASSSRVPSAPNARPARVDAGRPTEGSPAPEHYIRHYLSESGSSAPAGEKTMMIRLAYQMVQKKQRRLWRIAWLSMAAAGAVLIGVVVVQGVRHRAEQARLGGEVERAQQELEKERATALSIFYEIRTMEAQIAQLQMLMEEAGHADLRSQVAKLQESRRRLERRYDGYVEDTGLRRGLDPEERNIYQVARVFNESEFGMPADFVRRVKETIRNEWQTPDGRGRFERGVRHAEEMGYTGEIVRTLIDHGLAPQFFYLALQESDLDVNAIGPLTRWGRAKGMWQLIPRTALRFGLDPGPFQDKSILDPQDQRLDFRRSTEAAARYLRMIYGTLAQASGLLVVASYNWGEDRVDAKMSERPGPQAIPDSVFEGIAETAEARSYWRFLGEFSDRMPDETKDYVLRIFSAAVIGESPRRYGFAFDNPLERYLDQREPAP
jgi:hypothetical protein